MIDCTKFDVFTPSNFGGGKAHVLTHIYIFATYAEFDDVTDPSGQPPMCGDQSCQVWCGYAQEFSNSLQKQTKKRKKSCFMAELN